ncbi:MAG: methyltransferase domain-containing protein [Proteobacteria bacterium]|nr:methyltransferase domain-containing protein [Pseudomonadota bacterium]
MAKKRSHRMEKLARIYDDEILPVWGQPFARMLLRGLVVPERSQVLNVACGTGYVAVEIVRRMGRGSRLIAIDSSSTLLDVARRKVEKLGTRDVFFRTESIGPRLSFADGVYDLLVCNLGLLEMEDIGRALAEFARVVKPGGHVRCTIPLAGTYQEFYDIYREVLIKHDKHEILARLDEHLAGYATAADCEVWMNNAQLGDPRIEVEEFSMLFKSSREFFFAPVVEYGPLPGWKELSGHGQELQDIFWYIKEAIDAYFSGRAFEVSVKGACLIGLVQERSHSDIAAAGEHSRPEKLNGERPIAASLIESEEVSVSGQADGTREIDVAELEEIEEIDPDLDPDDIGLVFHDASQMPEEEPT